jgi:exonuclease III
LSLIYQNVRGLNTKIDQFYSNAIANDVDVIAITETWLRNDVLNAEYFNSNFNVYRIDNGRGRGALLAVKSKITCKQLNLVSPIEKADIIGMGLSYNDIHLSSFIFSDTMLR